MDIERHWITGDETDRQLLMHLKSSEFYMLSGGGPIARQVEKRQEVARELNRRGHDISMTDAHHFAGRVPGAK